MLNFLATLQQRCGNVLITSESNIVRTSETDVGLTLIFDRATTRQRQHRRCHNIVTTSLCRLGCWPRAYRQAFAGKEHIQCCLNLHVPALHKKVTCAMLTHIPCTTLHRNIICNVILIFVGQHCARELLQ